MNEQERELDIQLGDALAEIMKLNVNLADTMAERDALKANRDEYQIAADKLAMENKVLRDAAQVGLDALSDERYVSRYTHIDQAITQLQAALGEKS